MAKRTTAKDVIERRYLQLKLDRDQRGAMNTSVKYYIDDLKRWLKQSPKRTARKGGLGR